MRILSFAIWKMPVLMKSIFWLYFAHCCFRSGGAWESCAGDFLCPDSNLCCDGTPMISGGRTDRRRRRRHSGAASTEGYCLSGNRGSAEFSSCCKDDDDDAVVVTGCGKGFVCSTDENKKPMCIAIDPIADQLPAKVPRTKLCKVTSNMTHTFGLPMMPPNLQEARELQPTGSVPVAAYLSTHGAIHENESIFDTVELAILLVHGSSRNVDDYICCTSAALPSHTDPNSVLIVAPWFLAPDDGPVTLTPTASQRQLTLDPLRWTDMPGPVDDSPQQHTWRYGASAVQMPLLSNFSSLAVLDRFQDYFADRRKFPRLRQIVVTGHSAGGQLVQRWALLTSTMDAGCTAAAAGEHDDVAISIRTVVANPKNYVYLDARRWVSVRDAATGQESLEFRIPNLSIHEICLSYNEYLWGFEPSSRLNVPYLERALNDVNGNITTIVQRYAARNVIYLSGEQDKLLNGGCEANVQGPNRVTRSERYIDSIHQIFDQPNHHRRWPVPNVHHDHCLMYQSLEGQQALFGGPDLMESDESIVAEI
jgi:hypothetical protein